MESKRLRCEAFPIPLPDLLLTMTKLNN
jgi:hypothetical protein